jgi:hypothetical protein
LFRPSFLFLISLGSAILLLWYGDQSSVFWAATEIYSYSMSNNFYLYFFLFVGFIYFSALAGEGFGKNRQIEIRNYSIDEKAIKKLSAISFFMFILIFLLRTYYTKDVNFFAIIQGQATSEDVEKALENSPFGINGLALLFSYFYLILWQHSALFKYKNKYLKYGLFLAFFVFISQGKVQGLLYFFACYISQKKFSIEMIKRLILGLGVILSIFFTSRILRNQDQDLSLESELFLIFVFGNYLGAPIINSDFIFNNFQYNFSDLFYSQLIPKKLNIFDLSSTSFLPDPTSPIGVFGSSLVFGSILFSLSYAMIVGYLSGLCYRISKNNPVANIFLPFLFVACLFSMMYNHFANLTFFWIPLLLCWLVVRFTTKKLVGSN